MMDWFDIDTTMSYEEWKNKDKTEILDLIDFLQEIIDDEDDDADDE